MLNLPEERRPRVHLFVVFAVHQRLGRAHNTDQAKGRNKEKVSVWKAKNNE
jgi:hypothetical protein